MIPDSLRMPGRDDWLARLPRLRDDLLAEWGLRVDGAAMAGACALVVPVRTADGTPAALKISWPHWEADTEHLALRDWNGDGAVRLLRADPRRYALLLERADPARTLTEVPLDRALAVITGLYPRLHRPAPPNVRRLSEVTAGWATRLDGIRNSGAAPRRLIEHAASLARDFASDPATDGALIHSDLHYANVLGSLREDEPWLAIDPKPLSGDSTYEVAPLLWNRFDEYPADRIRDGILDRIWTVVDAMEWDEDRVRDWVIVRELCNVLWAVEDDWVPGGDWLTGAITIAKAAQR
ncbi:streptomycin 6-kinase [Friedmanniella endophytica]|uniref:Streptomycin 6-kinase n=1 Tax=Microlunatus kandeliicorticis TaxID=1759536 RepID=A0A7W3ISZ7_9ACTN|nr:aminoglycoside phosphotransferase family protein [Microlunatus kandeliicorticis]MBA8794672.1 streptomycin 6-kinase [Microlunatus kandeliicorticis]